MGSTKVQDNDESNVASSTTKSNLAVSPTISQEHNLDDAEESKRLRDLEVEEPLLGGRNQSSNSCERFVLFPIKYPEIWEMYKKAEASFWTAEEIDLSWDTMCWENSLTESERHFLKYVLAFFAVSDGVVIDNLARRFCSEVKIAEARCFYSFQQAIENIHSEVYSLLIETYVKDSDEKNTLFHAVECIPSVKKKMDWACRWIEAEDVSFAERLVAFAAVEGIFLSRDLLLLFFG